MLGDVHAIRQLRQPGYVAITRIKKGKQETLKEPEPPKTPPPEVFEFTYIIYGTFQIGDEVITDWFWCNEFAETETPPVRAEAYDGTTALRDGLAVVVSGTFYQ